MKYTTWIFAFTLATLLAAGQTQAQSAFLSGSSMVSESGTPDVASVEPRSDQPQNGLVTLHARVNEVNVLFIATDKHGRFVRDLNQADFNILDDHKPPQAILNFRRETDLPLHLGLLIDISGSVGSRFSFEQEASSSFLQHSLRSGFDEAFVLGFNSHTQMAQDFTDDYSRLYWAVHRLHNGGGTALYDAIYTACKEKFLKDHSDHPVRKAIIVVSDGEDNRASTREPRPSRWRSAPKPSSMPSPPMTADW